MILITRPEEFALKTKQKLEALGYKCKIFPLLKIRIKENALKNYNFDNFHYVIVTSSNSIKPLINADVRSQIRIYAVGEKTSNTLASFGFNIEGSFKTATLMRRFIIDQHDKNKNILYLAGSTTSIPLTNDLRSKGINITEQVVYQSIAVESIPNDILKDITVVLFYSPRTAKIFAALYNGDLSRISAICISENTANNLRELSFKSIKYSLDPTENSIFRLLK